MTHVSFQNINGYIDDIRYCVANFDIELGNYNMFTPSQLKMKGNDSNLLIVFYVQIMPDDFVMQLHRF